MTDPFEVLPISQQERLVEEDLPARLDPMLATLTDEPFSDPDWLYERKLDGERALVHLGGDGLRIRSRSDKELRGTYPEIADRLRELDVEQAVLDGEIVAFDGTVTSFARLQERLHITDPEEARRSDVRVWFYAFDLLHLDGRSTRRLALRSRKALLRRAVAFSGPLRLVVHRNEDGKAWLDDACERGWEGLIAKRADAPYHQGRSRDWLKLKCVRRQEFVIGGFTEPSGERERFGALLVGYHDGDRLRFAGKVGTGYDRETLDHLGDLLQQRERRTSPFDDETGDGGVHFVTPDLVAEVGFTEWTDDLRLRHPRYLGLRDDKDPADVVREVAD